MPVGNGGKFTTEARAIYELVLEMQKVRFAFLTSTSDILILRSNPFPSSNPEFTGTPSNSLVTEPWSRVSNVSVSSNRLNHRNQDRGTRLRQSSLLEILQRSSRMVWVTHLA